MMTTFLQSLQSPTGTAAAPLSSSSQTKRTGNTASTAQTKTEDMEGRHAILDSTNCREETKLNPFLPPFIASRYSQKLRNNTE